MNAYSTVCGSLGVLLAAGSLACGGRGLESPATPVPGDPTERAVVRQVARPARVEVLVGSPGDVPPNSSSSHDWAQPGEGGSVALVYAERIVGAPDHASWLVYRTIAPDGASRIERITAGAGVEDCVLLTDPAGHPHVFAGLQDGGPQDLVHFTREGGSTWRRETVSRFENRNGEFVVEMAAAAGPAGSLHLAVLQFAATPDHFLTANYGSRLFHLASRDGRWTSDLVASFDAIDILRNPTPDRWYMRPMRRLDLAMDASGHAHVAYGAIARQATGEQPTEMRYATNASGRWETEVAVRFADLNSDAGYNASIAVDRTGTVAVASTFVPRVPTGSATTAQLCYSRRENGGWRRLILVDTADGYLGRDGGAFAGAIPHLAFDGDDHAVVLFSDIASTHFEYGSFLTVGQIRIVRETSRGWEQATLYRQAGPRDYDHVDEIHSLCLLPPPAGGSTSHAVALEYSLSGSTASYRLLPIAFE